MLRRIYIDNYKCFSNFELKLGKLQLVLGANGSGKSALFEVLTSLRKIVSHGEKVEDVLPASSRTRWDMRDEQTFELEIDDLASTQMSTAWVRAARGTPGNGGPRGILDPGGNRC